MSTVDGALALDRHELWDEPQERPRLHLSQAPAPGARLKDKHPLATVPLMVPPATQPRVREARRQRQERERNRRRFAVVAAFSIVAVVHGSSGCIRRLRRYSFRRHLRRRVRRGSSRAAHRSRRSSRTSERSTSNCPSTSRGSRRSATRAAAKARSPCRRSGLRRTRGCCGGSRAPSSAARTSVRAGTSCRAAKAPPPHRSTSAPRRERTSTRRSTGRSSRSTMSS